MLQDDLQSSKLAQIAPSTRNLHVSAFGIHTGGGLVLLTALLAHGREAIAHVSLDGRLRGSSATESTWKSSYVRRSFLARACDSLQSAANVRPGDTLLCFNSLPPLRPVAGRVITYVHAPHLVGLHRGTRYRRLTALRFVIERAWFRLGAQFSDEFWVQTESMQVALNLQNPKARVKIVPFVDDLLFSALGASTATQGADVRKYSDYSFVYPADGVGHKNHVTLLAAWALLSEDGVSPRLVLSLDKAEYERLVVDAELDRLPNVEVRGHLSRNAMLESVSRSSALVFPSLAETFGLPLLEARALGVPIIASERDFVRDVCVPHQTFDPTSPRSIARAIRRFMDGAVEITHCYSAAQFMERLRQ
jgi:glycosyltransferase involved in cell wall biosynthesis